SQMSADLYHRPLFEGIRRWPSVISEVSLIGHKLAASGEASSSKSNLENRNPMKKLIPLCTVMLFAISTAIAQSGTPSSKATAAYNTAVGCSVASTTGTWTCGDIFTGTTKFVTADGYVEVMGSSVKVSNSQSLFADASLVIGLYTSTLVTTKPSKTSGGTNTS